MGGDRHKWTITVHSGPWFNIKMSSYQYRKSHCGDKTIFRPSYLHNGTSYTGKMISLYWIRALVSHRSHLPCSQICKDSWETSGCRFHQKWHVIIWHWKWHTNNDITYETYWCVYIWIKNRELADLPWIQQEILWFSIMKPTPHRPWWNRHYVRKSLVYNLKLSVHYLWPF